MENALNYCLVIVMIVLISIGYFLFININTQKAISSNVQILNSDKKQSALHNKSVSPVPADKIIKGIYGEIEKALPK